MWNMQTNRFSDEEGKIKDPDIGDKIDRLLEKIKSNFSDSDTAFYDRQFKFSNDLTEISHLIKDKNKDNGDRKKACLAEIQKISVPERVYLPSNPGCLVFDIDRKVGIPLQSAAKVKVINFVFKFEKMNFFIIFSKLTGNKPRIWLSSRCKKLAFKAWKTSAQIFRKLFQTKEHFFKKQFSKQVMIVARNMVVFFCKYILFFSIQK